LVDTDDDRTFPFFPKHLGEGTAGTGGNTPVDGADVVAGLIGTMFFEVDAAAADLGNVRAGHAEACARVVVEFEIARYVALVEQLLQGDESAAAAVLVLFDVERTKARHEVAEIP